MGADRSRGVLVPHAALCRVWHVGLEEVQVYGMYQSKRYTLPSRCTPLHGAGKAGYRRY